MTDAETTIGALESSDGGSCSSCASRPSMPPVADVGLLECEGGGCRGRATYVIRLGTNQVVEIEPEHGTFQRRRFRIRHLIGREGLSDEVTSEPDLRPLCLCRDRDGERGMVSGLGSPRRSLSCPAPAVNLRRVNLIERQRDRGGSEAVTDARTEQRPVSSPTLHCPLLRRRAPTRAISAAGGACLRIAGSLVAREVCNTCHKLNLPRRRQNLKRTTRLELATFGLGSRRSTN